MVVVLQNLFDEHTGAYVSDTSPLQIIIVFIQHTDPQLSRLLYFVSQYLYDFV